MALKTINKGLLYLCVITAFVSFIAIFSCSSNRYPCPAYNSNPNVKIDSTGAFTGGYRHNKDKKTGLIKKKKSRKLYDRKNQVRVY